MSLAEVTDLLRCPRCASEMRLDARVLGCARGHRFDVAKQGYVNLLGQSTPQHADTAEMVAARADFQSTQHFRPFADLLAQAAVGSRMLEVGAGTGYYLQHCLGAQGSGDSSDRPARGIASDLSGYACRRAAKIPHVGAIVADTWAGLPVADACIDTVVCAFAPRNAVEFARVLAPGGRLLVLTPTADHLHQLRAAHGLLSVQEDKIERLEQALAPHFALESAEILEQEVVMSGADQRNLVAMGPNAFHDKRLEDLQERPVTLAVRLGCYRHRD